MRRYRPEHNKTTAPIPGQKPPPILHFIHSAIKLPLLAAFLILASALSAYATDPDSIPLTTTSTTTTISTFPEAIPQSSAIPTIATASADIPIAATVSENIPIVLPFLQAAPDSLSGLAGSAADPASPESSLLTPPGTDASEVLVPPEPYQPPAPAPGPLSSAGVIVEGLVYDIPMPWGDPDFESARTGYMTKGGQKWLAAVMTGALPYLAYVEERVLYYGLPQELVYLPVIESSYLPGAVSRSGAVGLWQFMKNSINGYGMKIDDWVDERRDFMKSTDGALRKLADNFKALGDWSLAIAAYNTGLGAVTRALAKTGLEKPTVSDLRQQGLIAKETLAYVPRFLAVSSILRYPEFHGLPASWGEPSTWQALPANQPVDLSLLAELTGIPHEILKLGNQELRKETTPPNPNHMIKVPVNKAEAAKAILDDTSRPLIRYYTYKVKSGDNLGKIAKDYKVAIDTLIDTNPGLIPDKIKIDQIIRIPAYSGVKPPAGATLAAVPVAAVPVAAVPVAAVPVAATAVIDMSASAAAPSVDLASGLGSTATTISPAVLSAAPPPAGSQASESTAATSTTSPAPASPPTPTQPAPTTAGSAPAFSTSYTVVKGDTVWNISWRYKTTPKLLSEKNGIGPDYKIKIGQILAVPSPN